MMKITVLGSGTSHGVPVVGCGCPVCRSEDVWDRRMRSSLYIEGTAGETAVIDTGPEFRLQAIAAGITKLDAVFLSHAHADHIHGLDDIRPLSREKLIPVYGDAETIAEFRACFSYIFRETQIGGGKPRVETCPLERGQSAALGNLLFTPVPVKHGTLDIYGWKIREGAGWSAIYLTDTSCISEESYGLIAEGGAPELLIVCALRKRPHETHFTFDQALEAVFRIGAASSYLTHICHEHSHREIEEYCRACAVQRGFSGTVAPARDGLEVYV